MAPILCACVCVTSALMNIDVKVRYQSRFLSLSIILSAFGGVCVCGLFSRLVKDISSDKVRQELTTLRTQTVYPTSVFRNTEPLWCKSDTE